jgi:transcriptional regulator with XRE-family HTH domain
MIPSPTHTTNLVQAVRLHYGLSLALLARYLGVSASLLGLAATARRELPTQALLHLRPLAEALPPPWSSGPADADADAEPDPTPALAGPLRHPPDAAALRRRRAACRHLALRLARELEPWQRRQAQARHLLAVLPTLLALPPIDARAARALPLMEALVRERLSPGAGATLALLQARRQGLLAEVAQLTAWLGE